MISGLNGKTVVVTRARNQAEEMVRELEERGATAVLFPVIQTVLTEDLEPLDQALSKLEEYDWIMLTSTNGAKYFLQRLDQIFGAKWKDKLTHTKLAVIGPKTKEVLEQAGLSVQLMPVEYKQEGFKQSFKKLGQAHLKLLYPKAERARELLSNELKELGHTVDEIELYKTVKPEQVKEPLLQKLINNEIDVITFTSSSTIQHFMEIFEQDNIHQLLSSVRVACIGPITAHTAELYQLRPDIVATEYTVVQLIKAIEDFYREERS